MINIIMRMRLITFNHKDGKYLHFQSQECNSTQDLLELETQ